MRAALGLAAAAAGDMRSDHTALEVGPLLGDLAVGDTHLGHTAGTAAAAVVVVVVAAAVAYMRRKH